MYFLKIYASNCETVGKMVRSVNEMYLVILSPAFCSNEASALPAFCNNEASALSKFYLHPLRFIGTRLDCTKQPKTEGSLCWVTVAM